jgi:flavin-dependent dehydrogenase
MKIAIVGAGVSGSYLGRLLQKHGHEIEIFESSSKENRWAVCAWGAPRHILSKFSQQAGINFDNYILHIGKNLRIEHSPNVFENMNVTGLITYNKQKWEDDLLDGIKIRYGFRCTRGTFPVNRYDYVIDCTGVHRALLPKPKEDFLIPSYEYLVENIQDMDEFHIINYKSRKGYFWYFPLDAGRGFVGAGDIDRKFFGVGEFFEQHPEAKIVKKIGRPIRLCPPTRMEPFCYENIIGVGESIGCVFPITGEGIAPSLLCCDIFIDVLDKSGKNKFDFQQYRKKVLDTFGYYDDVYRTVRLIMDGKLNGIVDETVDLKKLFINHPESAKTIKEAAKVIETLSTLKEISEGLEYPITNFSDLIKKITREGISIGKKTVNQTDLKSIIPAYYFPISTKEDLVDKVAELFQDLCIHDKATMDGKNYAQ